MQKRKRRNNETGKGKGIMRNVHEAEEGIKNEQRAEQKAGNTNIRQNRKEKQNRRWKRKKREKQNREKTSKRNSRSKKKINNKGN